MIQRARTTPPGGGHTADSDEVQRALEAMRIPGRANPQANSALAALKRLEAAANRTAELAESKERWAKLAYEGRDQLLDALEREQAAEAERDAALARAELAEGKAQQNACDWADVKDERDAALAKVTELEQELANRDEPIAPTRDALGGPYDR